MKKLLCVTLTLIMLLSLSTAAFAVRSRDLYGYGKSGIATALEN